MSYTPPPGDGVALWMGATLEGEQPGENVDLNLGPELTSVTVTDTLLGFDTLAFVAEYEGGDDREVIGRLYVGPEVVQEQRIPIAEAFTLTFVDLQPGTRHRLQITLLQADGAESPPLFAEAFTLPGFVSGVAYAFTIDSLSFSWPAVTTATHYLLTLLRDGQPEQTLQVDEPAAVFEGLEDGTTYHLLAQAISTHGAGPQALSAATTQYLPPHPAFNLRQFEERIIAVICQWDVPTKVLQVRVQLVYGDKILYDEIRAPGESERTFPVPMASTEYLLRVRTGNPAGWSPWAEAWVHTEDYPLVDSRLAVMAAAYQEDALYLNTWDGASNQLKGVVEMIRAEPSVSVDSYRLSRSQPTLKRLEPLSGMTLSAALEIQAQSRLVKKVLSSSSQMALGASLSMTASSRLVKKVHEPNSAMSLSASLSITAASAKVRFRTYPSSATSIRPALTITATSQLV